MANVNVNRPQNQVQLQRPNVTLPTAVVGRGRSTNQMFERIDAKGQSLTEFLSSVKSEQTEAEVLAEVKRVPQILKVLVASKDPSVIKLGGSPKIAEAVSKVTRISLVPANGSKALEGYLNEKDLGSPLSFEEYCDLQGIEPSYKLDLLFCISRDDDGEYYTQTLGNNNSEADLISFSTTAVTLSQAKAMRMISEEHLEYVRQAWYPGIEFSSILTCPRSERDERIAELTDEERARFHKYTAKMYISPKANGFIALKTEGMIKGQSPITRSTNPRYTGNGSCSWQLRFILAGFMPNANAPACDFYTKGVVTSPSNVMSLEELQALVD